MALPGLRAGGALEGPHHLGRDPPAVVEPGLRLDAVLPHPAAVHPARVERDVVLDRLIAGVGRAVAPRGVLGPPAAGGPRTPRGATARPTPAMRRSRTTSRSTRAGWTAAGWGSTASSRSPG